MMRSRSVRGMLRALAALLFTGAFVGVPLAVARLVGSPIPKGSQLADSWHRGTIDSDLVLSMGATVFVALWLWFAVTAFGELLYIMRCRGGPEPSTLRPLPHGPDRLVRKLVRFIAVSSVTATASMGALMSASPTRQVTAHVVEQQLTTPLTREPTPMPVAQADPSSSATTSYVAGFGTALLLSGGVLGVLEARRRRQWRASLPATQLPAPRADHVRTEKVLRSVSAPERLARLDVALRAAATDLTAQHAVVVAAMVSNAGDVKLFLRGAALPTDDFWHADLNDNSWQVAAATPLEQIAVNARQCAQPCPAMVHLGSVAHGNELFVDLEAVGVLSVISPHEVAILRHVAASLTVSPFLDTVRLFTVGVGEIGIGDEGVEHVDTLGAALDAAVMTLGSTVTASRTTSTFALRASGSGGEAWEPAVVVAAGDHDNRELAHLAAIATPNCGLAAMVAVGDGVVTSGEWQLRADGDGHVLAPLGLRLTPVGCEAQDVAALRDLLVANEQVPAVPVATIAGVRPRPAAPFVEPDWVLMVNVFGHVNVIARDGTCAEFERSKALELVVWLSHHRRRPTRNAARAALWDLDVRDATFANVVSDARRALARAVAPPDGDEWIARTLTEDLPLHARVVTDADVLTARLGNSRDRPPLEAISVLRPALELVSGMPFAGTGFLWPDAEGLTSSLVLLAVGAATELAGHYLALGDVDGVFWATGQGLQVLAGHEELIALRMRSQACRGDLAGVRHEWESYERALLADPWAAAEPSPKLVALRRELLSRAG